MMGLYHILGTLVFAAALPLLPLVWLVSEKRRANLLPRLGLFTGFGKKADGRFRIWVHALSVGEVNSALPLVQGLKKARPEAEIVFTASTRTGYQTACRLMTSGPRGLVSEIGYFPFDLWFSVLRVLNRIEPDLMILVETDLWPGFISLASDRGIPLVLVNARLSSEAHRGYRRFGLLARPMFAGLSRIFVQTREDARRFADVGAAQDRVSVAGNIKFDQPMVLLEEKEREEIRKDLGIDPGQPAWIAGSTHEDEEAVVVAAFERLRADGQAFKLIVAPRNPDRSAGLARKFSGHGHHTACLSDPQAEKDRAEILFIDALGVLVPAYAAGSFAFVGGSLADQGGHNPLEPAMFGKPVAFGPHMEDFHEVARMLVSAGGAEQVHDGDSLAVWAGKMLAAGEACASMGQAAERVFRSNCGAVGRTIEIMEARGLV